MRRGEGLIIILKGEGEGCVWGHRGLVMAYIRSF